MENTNKKSPGQGKTPQQYTDSTRLAWYGVVGMVLLLILLTLLGGCVTTQPTKKCCDKEHVITEWDGNKQINWYSKRTKKD